MNTPRISTDQALQLDHQLCFALYSASLAMTKLYKPLLEDLGMRFVEIIPFAGGGVSRLFEHRQDT